MRYPTLTHRWFLHRVRIRRFAQKVGCTHAGVSKFFRPVASPRAAMGE
jgi:hypothetical protein